MSISITASVIFGNQEFSALNRQATVASGERDWGTAVELLKQAKALHGDLYQDTRLALYLQHAGRFNEAMKEFEWLLKHVEIQVLADLAHQANATEAARLSWAAHLREVIHDKARLACEREGRTELAKEHMRLYEKYEDEARRYSVIAERESRNATRP